jgi:hypothetical protein
MTFALVAASSVLALLLALCWAKEFRLRRALQSLLARVFTQWRNAREADDSSPWPRGRDTLGRFRRM